MVTILAKDPFELVEDIGDLTFEHVKGHLYISEVSGEEIEKEPGRGKAKEQCENPGNVKEDNKSVWQGKPEQCENLEKENNGKVWQLEKEAADAVARAAAAVSDLVADRLTVEETILSIGKASAAVLALAEFVGEESEEAERVGRRIESLHKLSLISASKEAEEKDERAKVERLAQDSSSLSSETLPLIKSSKDCSTDNGKRKRQPAKEELRRRQEEHLRRSLVDDDPL